ncbi:MAG TPA: KTSC domain-containing protein [Rhizomicrobium sp.]
MERVPVSSSSLASVGYEEETQTLEVEFLKTGVYQYFGVPSPLHEGLMTAQSVGTFFAANIRNSFPFQKVG